MTPSKEAKLGASKGKLSWIPLHIFEEIWLRLDIPSLFRCAFVCRDWNDLITNPKFIRRSTDRTFDSKNQILLIKLCQCKVREEYAEMGFIQPLYCRVTYSVHWDDDRFGLFRTMESPPIDDFKDTGFVGVSNGLVCLVKIQPFQFILWNLTIRKYVLVPLSITWSKTPSVGFGFDSSSDDFKIVSLLSCPVDGDDYIESAWVFSYATWSWKHHLICNIPPLFQICSMCVCFNGVLHWIADVVEPILDAIILTFDLEREVFGHIPLPEGMGVNWNFIVTTGDSIAVVAVDEVEEEINLSTWIMKEYGNHESWTCIFSTVIEATAFSRVLGMRKNGDVILEIKGRLHIYNSMTSTNVYNPMTSTNALDLVEAMKDGVLFRYHTESLYLLEKKECLNSY